MLHKARYVVYVCAVFLLLLFVGACHSAKKGEASAKALASSSQNARAISIAKADLTKCVNSVPTVGLLRPVNRKKVSDCVNRILTPADKQKLETCLTNAAVKDHLLTVAGRNKFKTVDVGNCVNQVA